MAIHLLTIVTVFEESYVALVHENKSSFLKY